MRQRLEYRLRTIKILALFIFRPNIWYTPNYSPHLPTCLISVWKGGNIRLIIRYRTLSEWVHAYDIANAVAFIGQNVWYAPYYSPHLPTCLISVWKGGNIRLIVRYGTLSEWVHAHDIANAVACTGYLLTCLIYSLLFTPPTNVSDIGLNRGKYPSHYQVGNAVSII